MSGERHPDGTDTDLPPLLPPLIKTIPSSLRRYEPDDPTPRGDQSITLDEEDERILDRVWAEIARYPRTKAPTPEGQPTQPVTAAAKAAVAELNGAAAGAGESGESGSEASLTSRLRGNG